MSGKTDTTEQASSKKYPLRLQMPVGDPDVDAFLAAQGVRSQSQAIVMLIRMWVNEFGPVNVLEQTMEWATATNLKRGPTATPPSDSSAAPRAVIAEASPAHPVAEKQERQQVTAAKPDPAPAPAARRSPPSDDIHDMFRQ